MVAGRVSSMQAEKESASWRKKLLSILNNNNLGEGGMGKGSSWAARPMQKAVRLTCRERRKKKGIPAQKKSSNIWKRRKTSPKGDFLSLT